MRYLVDDAIIGLTIAVADIHLSGMPHSRIRPQHQPPREELIRLRHKHYPGMTQREFAQKLGITRLHLISIEKGYRRPSSDLVLRWLELLAPEGRLSMFGDVPGVTALFRSFHHLQKISPQIFQAA
jgi:DNA-binding XRE family transcriptional regulator